tara:strand:+ start:790 stop:1362 length:573 start_codon:yes stop_codon:yes gene_type:complete
MNWTEYTSKFSNILDGTFAEKPYDNSNYVEYVKLNNSRVKRWNKRLNISDEIKNSIAKINSPQTWILIIEHWCGDAANSAPVIHHLAELNDNITLDIQLRDDEPRLIEQYLTNGGESVPKLIVRDQNEEDLFTWGPRPKECQALVMMHKESDKTELEKKSELQNWYNDDKGQSILNEITELVLENITLVI